jgi:hypothetical protein
MRRHRQVCYRPVARGVTAMLAAGAAIVSAASGAVGGAPRRAHQGHEMAGILRRPVL